jgi:hypothetical protein
MKKYLALGFALSLCFACAQNYQQRVVTNPQPIEFVFTSMLETLEETDYKIQTFARKRSRTSKPNIIAEKQFLEEGYTLRPNINFLRINQITHVEIRVHWRGEKKRNQKILDKAAKELAEIFEEKLNKK